ncbi:MAG: response regulator transcription factor [Cyanobacteria bacterium]|nr:response regulator transcription factor [Cyanobacteriota bacterium]
MRILLVEDQYKLALYIKRGLENQSYSVDCVYDGETAEKNALYGEYDLIILDIMLPKKDGIAVCKSLRSKNIDIPILMLTAKIEIDDKVIGLDSGADDYLAKPFSFDELLARVRALLRRPKEKKPEILTAQDLVMDNSKHLVKKGNEVLSLTTKEYAVLEYLIINKDKVVNREQILDHCWDISYNSFSNIVDVYIKRIRKILDNKNYEKYIQTIRGIGYKFKK